MNVVETLGLEHVVAERTVLAAMRADLALAVNMIERLNSDCFVRPENKLIFDAFGKLMHGIEPIDTLALVNMANGIAKERKAKTHVTAEYIGELTGNVLLASDYAETLSRYSTLRNMAEFAFWFVKELESKPDPNVLFAAANEKFRFLQPARSSGSFVYGWDTVALLSKAVRERRDLLVNGERKFFDFPWASWNEIVAPLTAGMVGTLYGPTKAGKSVYFEQIAEYWAMLGHHVVLVHLEDDLQYKLNRRAARHSKVDYNRIVTGNLTDNEIRAIDEHGAEIKSLFADRLHYFHAPGKSASEICSEIDRRKQEGICDAVVIDYLDKIQPSLSQMRMFGDKIWERQAHDMEQIKSCMERNHIVCFTGGQGTKDMQDNTELDMRNIAGSGQKLHKSQLVMMFGRKRVGDKPMTDAKGEIIARPGSLSPFIDIGVVAQNQGESGTFKQVINGKRLSIIDWQKQ